MNKANMKLTWGKNLFSRKKRGKSGAFLIFQTNTIPLTNEKKPLNPLYNKGFIVLQE